MDCIKTILRDKFTKDAKHYNLSNQTGRDWLKSIMTEQFATLQLRTMRPNVTEEEDEGARALAQMMGKVVCDVNSCLLGGEGNVH